MLWANICSTGCIGVLLGVFLASFFNIHSVAIALLFCAASFGCLLFWNNEKIRYGSIVLVASCAGIVLYYHATVSILEGDIAAPQDPVSFYGHIEDVDRRSNGRVFLRVEPQDTLQYPVRITTYNDTRAFAVGDKVQVQGVLEVPQSFNGFDYRGYLAKEGIAFVAASPTIVEVGDRKKNVATVLFDIRMEMARGLEKMLPPDNAALYKAMLLGQRGDISRTKQDAIRGAGLSHIVAISGLHIALLFGIVFIVLSLVPVHRTVVGAVAVLCIAFYIMMIGAPASAVRAGLMIGALLLASTVGRPNVPYRVLLLVATIMVCFNPLIVRYDIGFQLSFAAVAAILFVVGSRTLSSALRTYDLFNIRSFLLVTVAAYLATFPLVLLHFDDVAEWGIIANILVVPLIPALLVAGIIVALLGVIGAPALLAAPAFSLSWYVLEIAQWLS
ncbi:MAG: ComEC family competence protein [Candidatus Spechtbacteria bacterium SB0662_bin_43]|uniref:ComEC family competence protein n=1 Tax=Candidatus Spechtbacteria bacterium SB0662_bin_43 TaxID=2604897 RepID=A0A845DBS5_9BACT|nr:ComEC family competence protein [Candidatus Spechtbacteria bacterium SB0662_bin_43]